MNFMLFSKAPSVALPFIIENSSLNIFPWEKKGTHSLQNLLGFIHKNHFLIYNVGVLSLVLSVSADPKGSFRSGFYVSLWNKSSVSDPSPGLGAGV